jgi:hypothetical protein
MKNQDISYQNRETGDLNPLMPTEVSDIKPSQKPINPKVKLLAIISISIIILLIISLIISLVKKSPPATTVTLTPTGTQTAAPTGTPNSAIPTEFQEKFNQIDQNNQTDVNFNPPAIDPNIGQ